MSVFLVFALGIVIPSGFLSYLGLRSYQYESALLRKELAERYQTVADVMQSKILEHFQTHVGALRHIAAKDSVVRWNIPGIVSELSSMDRLGSEPLEYVAFFDAQDRMIFPIKQDFREPPAGPELNWETYTAEIRHLENLEFGQNRVQEALSGYQALLRKPLGGPLRAALWLDIGAAAGRIGKGGIAESAYLALLRDHETLRDPSGLPLGLVARRLLAHVYDTQGKKEKAFSTRLDLFEALLIQRWGDFSGRDPGLAEVTARLRADSTAPSEIPREIAERWRLLQTKQTHVNRLQTQTSSFLRTIWPEAIKRLHRRGWVDQGGLVRLRSQTPASWLLAVPVMNRAGDSRLGLLVAMISAEKPWSQIMLMMNDLVRPTGLRFILSDAVSAKVPGWQPTLTKTLNETDPPLTLTIFQPAVSTQDQLSRKRLWIYGGMVSLSLLVIVIGLWMMSRAVRREMEIAQLKSDFVANVSHELRTPLSAISYIAQMLNRGRYRSESDVKDFYVMLGDEAGRLQELIEDILDFSKMLGGKKIYHKEPVDLTTATREAMERLQSKADLRGFHLNLITPAISPVILADRRAIVQALSNLIDNAIKYSGGSRAIEITVSQTDGEALAEVADHGIGIDASEQQRIFEKFYRVEKGAAQDVQGGVGLGLAMVQHIMQSHEGQIEVRSEVGKGSVFTLRFPRATTQGETA